MIRLPATASVCAFRVSGIARAAAIVAGIVFGLLAGAVVTAGVVVARTVFEGHYLEDIDEVASWQGLAVPVAVIVSAAAGAIGPGVLLRVVAGSVAGATIGGAGGALVAAVASADSVDRWAAATVVGAAGVVIGFILGWVASRRARRSSPRTSATVAGACIVIVGASVAAFSGDTPTRVIPAVPVPADAGNAEAVVVLLGDPGAATFDDAPILRAAAADVAAWADGIGRDSAVAVVVLGDIVYPDGMRASDTDEFLVDSTRVTGQVAVVRTSAALDNHARMYFVAGNHDWGLRGDWEGVTRLRRLEEFLLRERARGSHVQLLPRAGEGIPQVVDVGSVRLILLDTAWWLLGMQEDQSDDVFAAVAAAMAGAGSRHVVLASHHPFASAGPHGGIFPAWRTLGLRWLLNQSGALLQNLESRPYRELRAGLGAVFREHGRPLAWAGGHEHALEVIAHDSANAPRFTLVSGSASKLSDTGMVPGTMFTASRPGYIRLIARDNGAVDAEVVAAPDRFLSCAGTRPEENCMADGVGAFRVVYSTRLVPPR